MSQAGAVACPRNFSGLGGSWAVRRVPLRPRRMLSSRFAILIVVLTTGGLAGAPSLASADTSASVNWAGYVAHKSGVSFRSVAAKWKQPAAVCSTP